MPPVTQKPPISAEGIKAKNSIAEVRQQVNLGATPQEARATLGDIKKGYIPSQLPTQPLVATRLNPTIPNVIPSTALAGNKTFEDVMDTRANLETQATAKQQLTDRIKGTTDRIGATTSSTFENPDAIINRLALNRVPTETEAQRAAKQAGAVQNRRDYAGDIATARQDLGTQYGLPDLTARKAEVTTQYTEREQKMNDDIKRLEENASKRGVARQYVEAEKQKIKSDALEDLSNYAAIEAALSGSITEARSIINDSINDKKSAFELENQSIQQEIDYLSTLVGEDNQREATQLQIALDERKRLQDAQLAKETAIRNYAADVAAEGADDGTINAILKSGTEEEALRYAAPYLGKTNRMLAQANLANTYSQIDSRNLGDLITKAEKGDQTAIDKLGFDPKSTTGNFEAETGLRKEFNGLKVVQDATQVQNSFNQINSAYTQALGSTEDKTSKAAADQALVISFNKMLDPGSVVREGEFARSTEGQSLINQWQGKVEKLKQGGVGLTDGDRASIVNLTRVLYADYIKTHNNKAYEFRQNAVRQGGDPSYVASYMDTVGLTAEAAQDGDIIIKGGQPYEKQGDQMVPLDI
jgi:hypothetical protein